MHWAFTTGDQRFSVPVTAYYLSVYTVRDIAYFIVYGVRQSVMKYIAYVKYIVYFAYTFRFRISNRWNMSM